MLQLLLVLSTDQNGCVFGSIADGTCSCDIQKGWAGAGKTKLCQNCWAESTVVSSDKQTCVTCSQKYCVTKGLVFDKGATYYCKIDIESGYAGKIENESIISSQYPLINCWSQKEVVAGWLCADCNIKYRVAQGIVFNDKAEYKCSADTENGYAGQIKSESTTDLTSCWEQQRVVKFDGLSCVNCSAKYSVSSGMIFDKYATFKCLPDTENGYARKIKDATTFISEYPLSHCWNSKQVVNIEGGSCQTCNNKYILQDGMIYDEKSKFKCSPDSDKGYIAINQETSTISLTSCWDQQKVVDIEHQKCVSCNEQYQVQQGLQYNSKYKFNCQVDISKGYAGNIETTKLISTIYPLKNCWSSQQVVSQDGLICNQCNIKYGVQSGLLFNDNAQLKCQLDTEHGYAGLINDSKADITFCWSQQKVVNHIGSQCITCNQQAMQFGLIFDATVNKCICDVILNYNNSTQHFDFLDLE
ncbi:Hypothetical_protein [Hexamita inflata]|uniref:Hypothetical_protein n=1 Tax=Hexamita inflata TaxID=28002 RepID=A0AA86U1P3_9EUKA|nr:Hypothetical protein HINF_LOCUS15513 [Hexamita inflata]